MIVTFSSDFTGCGYLTHFTNNIYDAQKAKEII